MSDLVDVHVHEELVWWLVQNGHLLGSCVAKNVDRLRKESEEVEEKKLNLNGPTCSMILHGSYISTFVLSIP